VAAGRPQTPPDVLIADDDPTLRAGLCGFFSGRSYRCAAAGDGAEALSLARKALPPCLFVDLGMPGLDGFAVARELRADPHTSGMHIHCLTGRTDPETLEEATRAGFELLLTKPVEPDALLDIVRRSGWIADLNKAEMENLLDWLERRGCTQPEASCVDERTFSVRFVCPPGLRLSRDEDGTVQLIPA
jgi:CheY-like chemotaxis protein